jgi:hypothetical protein
MPVFLCPTLRPLLSKVADLNVVIGRVEGGFLNLLFLVVMVRGVPAPIAVENPETVRTSVIVAMSSSS